MSNNVISNMSNILTSNKSNSIASSCVIDNGSNEIILGSTKRTIISIVSKNLKYKVSRSIEAMRYSYFNKNLYLESALSVKGVHIQTKKSSILSNLFANYTL